MRKKVALMTNIIAPYRIPVYEELARYYDLTIYIAGNEDNREQWCSAARKLMDGGVVVKRSWGVTMKRKVGRSGGVHDIAYTHINPGYLWDLIKARPDAVISTEMGTRTVAAVVYGWLFRRPVWIWWGGTLRTESGRGAVRRGVRLLLSRGPWRWISYGATSTEYLLSLGVEKKRVLQIQNCVDEGLYRSDIEPAIKVEPRPVLLYVGQMVGRKGTRLLLEAAVRAWRDGEDFSLVLVGDGPERGDLEVYARERGLRHVYFYPAQPPDAMPAIYRSADCLVFPTLEDVWGLVVNEALWSGIPVLASIYAGCTSEIVPKRNRFDPLDPADFDRALRLAISGQLAPPDTSVLLTSKQVADMIIADLRQVLRS